MMNINNTDHFLLARREPARRSRISRLEWATISLAVVVLIGISTLLI